MADEQLNVHDVQMQHTYVFGVNGQAQQRTRVTFFVGSHGPFTMDYAREEGTSDRIQSDIQHQVVELRRIVTGTYGG